MVMQQISESTTGSLSYKSKELEHLGLVAGMLDELGMVEQVDAILPKDEEKQTLSHGQAVKAMILNGLGFTNRALYLTPQFFKNKPVERLIGEGVTAEQINEYTLGRTLDAIYRYGAEAFYSQLSVHAVRQLGLTGNTAHLDSSSFHVDGKYNHDNPPETDSDLIHITQGYSRDHRPDLNQLVLNLIVENQAGIPLLMEALSGNSNDKTSFKETIKNNINQLNSDFKMEYIVADSAFYTEETLKLNHDIYWISRVPETLKMSREFIEQYAPKLMQQSGVESSVPICCRYGDVEQRWLVVYSPQAYQRALKTLARQCSKQGQQEHKAIKALLKQAFACQPDAVKAVEQLQKTLKMTRLTDIEYIEIAHYKASGRPAKDATPTHTTVKISATLYSDIVAYQQKLQRKSCFIIATNQLNDKELSDESLLKTYKSQQKVERGFRFLKDPMFMASTIFLKSIHRVMALMAIMTLCLMTYAALEYRIRTALREAEETFPDQKGEPVANPTARWIFQYFSGIHVLSIDTIQVIVLNMNDVHRRLVQLLGSRYVRLYS